MSAIDLMFGNHVLITGVEDDPDEAGALRVYIGPRSACRYVLVAEEDQERVRSAWRGGGHVTMPRPDAHYVDDDQLERIAARNAQRQADFLAGTPSEVPE